MELERAKQAIASADAILIGAGAGMSVPAGIDLMDTKSFAKNYPAMLQYGFTFGYQLMGYPYHDDRLKWGYLSASLHNMFQLGKDDTYQKLFKLVKDKEYFVVTTNIDRLFHKNDFSEERVYTPQGDTSLFQCKLPCSDEVWDAKVLVEEMVKHIDPETQFLTREDLIPRCPNCGGEVYMNVRSGGFFIDDPYLQGQVNLNNWLKDNGHKKLVFLEIGVGYNTPGVIRFPFERMYAQLQHADFIRINMDDSNVPLGGIGLQMDIETALNIFLTN
ncbi:NAD-dependent protein deacetylase of SIR2 family [Puteibacter caeruleilacunae]|nr:NAD-dependent protein deacetylase of SIR2 family [Puteibacter caeruleilacunae]